MFPSTFNIIFNPTTYSLPRNFAKVQFELNLFVEKSDQAMPDNDPLVPCARLMHFLGLQAVDAM